MISVSKKVGTALAIVLLAAPVYAQVCKEAGKAASGKANMNCDMTYRNALITCDKEKKTDIVGTRASCPPKPMPMIDTPKKSPIADYTPYLYFYPRDGKDPSRPYAGAYGLGTPGDATRTFQLFGNTAPGTKRLASCTTQIKVPTDPTTQGEWAKLTRLQIDNCTNQYILNASQYPVTKSSSKLLAMDDPENPGAMITVDTECQPMKTFSTDNEYDASVYLEAAWKKLLDNPKHRMTTPSALTCVPCIGDLVACDREPHLPCGTTIENPLQAPSPFPEVRLSSIATVKFEEINDPSHPFSPRWDYLLADRDYSNLDLAQLGLISPTYAAIKAGIDSYMVDTKNRVFCAGVRESTESDAKKKSEDEVKVDVLGFRRDMFDKALKKRVTYNTVCHGPTGNATVPVPTPMSLPAFAAFIGTSWCYKIDGFIPGLPPQIIAHNIDCWKCYGLSGKVNDEGANQHPPCTTHYKGEDQSMKVGMAGGLNGFKKKAQCGEPAMIKVCEDLRRPYTSINKLKMRYHRTDDDDDKDMKNNVLTDGALEGMTFKEYFGNHMPYPRMWDMGGVSLQKKPTTNMNEQPPTDTTGQYVAIVGIGREAASKLVSDAAGADADGKKLEDKYPDQRCKIQGWGDTIAKGVPMSIGGATLTVPDPVTSWTEMKLYQTRALNSVGMSCIGRYEKMFKPGSAENMMMLVAGGEWQRLLITQCDKDKLGTTKNCKAMTIKEYADAGKPANTDSVVYLKQLDPQLIPQPWRGYMAAEKDENKFPTWGNGSPVIKTGLDEATMGDIIMLPNGPKDESGKGTQGLAKLAFVIETRLSGKSDCDANKNCYIRVLEPDNGKWPDSCGTTDTWGEMKTRYYFKPGNLPPEAKKEYDTIASTGNCVETKLSHCEMTAWDSLKVYRIREDKRTGCKNKEKAINCEKDE